MQWTEREWYKLQWVESKQKRATRFEGEKKKTGFTRVRLQGIGCEGDKFEKAEGQRGGRENKDKKKSKNGDRRNATGCSRATR